MQAEIAIAEPEPALAAEPPRFLEGDPGLVRPSPAALLVGDVGQRIQDAVEIGRDVKTEHLDVVADVPDHGDACRIGRAHETAQEPRAADAARERHDPSHVSDPTGEE